MSPTWLFLFPGALLLLLGLLAMATISSAPLVVGSVHLGIHTLLVSGLAVLVGQQLLLFAVFAKKLAVTIGLHGPSGWLHHGMKWMTLERGVLVGMFFAFLGVGTLASQVWWWQEQGFGPLDPRDTMRWVIPAVVSIAFGTQLLFGSFCISFLNFVRGWLEVSTSRRAT